jgi:hypothetical protein
LNPPRLEITIEKIKTNGRLQKLTILCIVECGLRKDIQRWLVGFLDKCIQ